MFSQILTADQHFVEQKTTSRWLLVESSWQRRRPIPDFRSQHAHLGLRSAGQGAGCVGSAVAAGAGVAAAAAEPPPCCGSVAVACPRCWSSRPPRRRGRSSRSARWRTRWPPGSVWWSTVCPCSQSQAASVWARSRWTGCRLSSGWSCCADSPCTGNRGKQMVKWIEDNCNRTQVETVWWFQLRMMSPECCNLRISVSNTYIFFNIHSLLFFTAKILKHVS